MLPLPRRPLPRAGLYDQIDYLEAMAAFLGDAAMAILQGQRTILSMSETFQSDLDRNTAATAAVGTAVTNGVADIKALLAQLSTSTPPTQAQLDQLNASSTALESAAASLNAADAPASPPATA